MKSMGVSLSGIARWLHMQGGFWFPATRWFIDKLFCIFSMGHRLNAFLDRWSLGGPWVSEFYQFIGVLVGVCWIALIEKPFLTSRGWIVLGLFLVTYRIAEIVLFSFHWLLVAEGSVQSSRRSLLGFLFNLCEIGIFFTIVYLLLGWFDPPQDAWAALFNSLSSVFSLEVLAGLKDAGWPKAVARLQLGISWALVVLILANVVGAIDRGEKS